KADLHHPLSEKILSREDNYKDFREWGFDIFVLDKEDLGLFTATVFAYTGLSRAFGISMQTFAHFMSSVSFYMSRNPRVCYHNLYHAVDVMHACSLMISRMGVRGLLTELEELALLLAGLCHDLDHPGLNNKYQVATSSPLALRYNDHAPLEHHHLSIAFQIMRRERCNILGHLDPEQKVIHIT
ncbi:unnamed protein product, partial [Choristocarpus tenellus]